MNELKPPCDCIQRYEGTWIAPCYCMNTGDAQRAAVWCEQQNESEKAKNWWCPECRKEVPPIEVTYEETHDVRAGGCGVGVLPERPTPPSSNQRCSGFCMFDVHCPVHGLDRIESNPQIAEARAALSMWANERWKPRYAAAQFAKIVSGLIYAIEDRPSRSRVAVLARFIRGQIALADRPPPGCIQLNNEEAAVCAEALEKITAETTTPLAVVVEAHCADLEKCLPTLREYRLLRTADQVEQSIGELRRAVKTGGES